MREKIFQDEWRDSWRFHHPGCHIIKIPDMPRAADQRFNPVKPYDFYAIYQDRFFAMELKLKTQLEGFSFKDVTEGQLNNLKEAKENGACSLIVINYRIQKISDRQRKKNDFLPEGRLNIVFIFDIDLFMDLDKRIYSKSIPVKMLFEPWVRKMQKVGDYWDIPSLTRRVE